VRSKIISSLEKCFLDDRFGAFRELAEDSMLKNEIYSFQVCYDLETVAQDKKIVYFHVESPLADTVTLYQVKSIPSLLPGPQGSHDGNYLRTAPGLYPDLLEPITPQTRLPVHNILQAVWVEIDPHDTVPAGTYPVDCVFTDEQGQEVARNRLTLRMLDARLPEQRLIYTQWFYTDCLMQYYGTEAFDEKHWQIIENFMGNARKYGMNMILTPILTPELDTYVGGQRPTTQLVDVAVNQGIYSFDFSKLGRWVDLCDKVGIAYLEINHFFSQWGATACPKVMATVDGVAQQIFGWDTPSDGNAYREFLYALIPAMLDFLKAKNGADKRCFFHISDEPNEAHLEQYRKVSTMIAPLVEGYPVIDALSHYSFYEQGIVKKPIPSTYRIEPFLENQVSNLWCYHCGESQYISNRFFSMPSARTRILGIQLYKFQIEGFLHWGYNFYNNQFSYHTVNPFLCSDGEFFSASGNTYSVYPGADGQPWPSLRQAVFQEGLQDLRLLTLCEQLLGRQRTMEILEAGIAPITFKQYPWGAQWLLELRKRLHKAIEEAR